MNTDQTFEEIEKILSSDTSDSEKNLWIHAIIAKNQKLVFKTIQELLKYNFIVPDYQRGYKWKAQQVTDLLNDIHDFSQAEHTADQFYCLQPVIVKKSGTSWDVIDGQQRLTTIYLILTFLGAITKSGRFSLDYNTRDDSRRFLEELIQDSFDGNIQNTNVDVYHFTHAMKTIRTWFEKTNVNQENWKSTLLEKTQVIWYQPDALSAEPAASSQKEEIQTFARINSGKIPLTNSELIRALFIHNSKQSDNEQVALLQQNKIATEWDHIEQQLHDEDFWCFITLGNPFSKKEYPNRIELLFDLIEQREKERAETDDHYSTFRMYNDWLAKKEELCETCKTVPELWQEIKNIYYRFHEWYIDRELYHLTGYARLADIGLTTAELIKKADLLKQSALSAHIKKRIWEQMFNDNGDQKFASINHVVSELSYENSKNDVRKVLLLSNITMATQDKHTARFNFRSYTAKDNKWDIEHIRSQTPSPQESKLWLKYVKDELINKLSEELKSKMYLYESLPASDLQELANAAHEELEGTESDSDFTDNIGNLCLLDSKTNRGYGNAIFSDKRKIIIERVEQGQFVPPATQNVFLKIYSKDLSNMNLWQKIDAENYQNNMIKMISTFLGGK